MTDILMPPGSYVPGVNEDRLATIIRMQKHFQENILGHNFADMLGTPKMGDYFRTQAFSLMTEIGEASTEVAWKPWASDTSFINHKAYRSELIDALHFLINLMLLDDMSADEIYEGYLEKQRKNRARQANGYDGVSSKCPSCKRDYNDAGVTCTGPSPQEGYPGNYNGGVCEKNGPLTLAESIQASGWDSR